MSFWSDLKTAYSAYTAPTIPQGGITGAPQVTPKTGQTGTPSIVGLNEYGGINFTPETEARIANINCELQPKAFLGKTIDFYG